MDIFERKREVKKFVSFPKIEWEDGGVPTLKVDSI